MKYKNRKLTKYTSRRDYSSVNVTPNIDKIDLLSLQIDKFRLFEDESLYDLLKEEVKINIYDSIRSNYLASDENLIAQINFKGVEIGKPRLSLEDAILYNKNYEAPVYIRLELKDSRYGIHLPDEKIYFFDLPLMLNDGTFIINGVYKVIVPQIIRSTGLYFSEITSTNQTAQIFKSTIIPLIGIWIVFEYAIKKATEKKYDLNLRIDQTRKISAITFLKALDIDNKLLFRIFGQSKWLKKAILKPEDSSLFDIKKNTEIINCISSFDTSNSISEEAFKKIKIIGTNNNELYIALPKVKKLSELLATCSDDIENEINELLDGLYNINFIFQGKSQIADNMKKIIVSSESSSKRLNLKKLIVNKAENVPNKLINKLTDQNKTEFNDVEAAEFKEKSDVNNKFLADLTGQSIFALQKKINELTNKLINFQGFSTDFDNFLENDVIDEYVSRSHFETKSRKIRIFDANQNAKIFYTVLKPGDPIPQIGAKKYIEDLFLDSKKYYVNRSGINSIVKKLNVVKRILGKTIATPICDKKGKVIVAKNTYVNQEVIEKIVACQKKGYLKKTDVLINKQEIQWDEIEVVNDRTSGSIKIVGICPDQKKYHFFEHIYLLVSINYLANLENGIGVLNDIDALDNRRIRTINELLCDVVKINFSRIRRSVAAIYLKEIKNKANFKPSATLKKIFSSKNLSLAIREFFNTSQLAQFLDQTNPLSNISNKRKITALGPGGLSKERAGVEVRDVHSTHFSRICPIETREGAAIGLISNLSCYAKIDEDGFILSPYHPVINGKVKFSKIEYLAVSDEIDRYFAGMLETDENDTIIQDKVISRFNNEPRIIEAKKVNYMCIATNQIISIATSLIPFLENDDSNRALMGANMQRQALPLMSPDAPTTGTGSEASVALYSKLGLNSNVSGKVVYVDANRVLIEDKDKKRHEHKLTIFQKNNQQTLFHQKPLVHVNDRIKKGDLIADGPSMSKGELALGKNVVVALSTFYGYNFEDAIVISERLAKEDAFTSIHIDEYKIEVLRTKMGNEEATSDIPNISDDAKKNLDFNGIVSNGTTVKEGDILVGKITPKATTSQQAEIELLNQIFGKKAKNVKNSSLVVPNGVKGVVIGHKILTKDKEDIGDNVLKVIKVYIVKKRKIQTGDKMAGRHGNKGIISCVLPVEDMPFLEDGTPVDVVLNPLGVPSRMNIGQILELQLSYALEKMNEKIMVPAFCGLSFEQIQAISEEAKTSPFGKQTLYNGFTGEPFPAKIAVGSMYMMKLNHMVEDKIHARCTGKYSLITQQPLGGKTQNGGQRFGEMEVWALEGYGAANLLQEMLTIKSDDINGRVRTYQNIIQNKDIPRPQTPASINLLFSEIRALNFNISVKSDRELFEEEQIANLASQDSQQGNLIKQVIEEEPLIAQDKNMVADNVTSSNGTEQLDSNKEGDNE